jgi:uncharacterized damage-inducible protein DinB
MNNPELYAQAPSYCHYYFDLIETDDLMLELHRNKALVLETLHAFLPAQADYRYAPGKWSVREVFRHILDTERIYAYRALRFSRKDKTELPGFEENAYIEHTKDLKEDWQHLAQEFISIRESSIWLYKPMTRAMLTQPGIANQVNYTPETIGFMMIGHAIHHCKVLMERYT